MIKVLFCEFTLSYEANGQTMYGWSGQCYGTGSRWNQQWRAQSIEITFANERDFRDALTDLIAVYSFFGRRWVPVVIQRQPQPQPVITPTLSSKPRYFELRAIAKRAGVDTTTVKSYGALEAAIKERELIGA